MKNKDIRNKLLTYIQNNSHLRPSQIASLAVEILAFREQTLEKEFIDLKNLYFKVVSKSEETDILDKRINYALKIINGGEMIYEDIVKLYSVLEECYVLKKLGFTTTQNLNQFYISLNISINNYSNIFSDIEKRFKSDNVKDFKLSNRFLD